MRVRRTPLTAIMTAALGAVLLTAALLTTGTAGVAAAQPTVGSVQASVPWNHVGAGWVLTPSSAP